MHVPFRHVPRSPPPQSESVAHLPAPSPREERHVRFRDIAIPLPSASVGLNTNDLEPSGAEQLDRRALPRLEKYKAGHATHVLALVAPTLVEYVP